MKIFKKKINDECWNIDAELVKWINEHLKVYLEDASSVVDLTYHKYKYKNKEYTQEEIIKELIKITDELRDDYYLNQYNENTRKLVNKMYDLLKLVHFQLWW